jgi:hypothetical protein
MEPPVGNEPTNGSKSYSMLATATMNDGRG